MEGFENTSVTTEETTPSTTENVENKTYTQAELDDYLQRETDRRVSAALQKAERSKAIAVKEAEKLATMNQQERYEHELKQRESAIAEKERQIALMENKGAASQILSEKGISLSLVDFVVAEDADTMKANIDMLDKAFKASVKAEVEKRLATNTPKRNLPLDGALTKESFSKLSLAQQSELFKSNPELFHALNKN